MLLSDHFQEYYKNILQEEPEAFSRLRQHIASLSQQDISVSYETGKFLALLIGMTKRKNVFEAGTFFGYSSAWLALGNPLVHVTTCDIQNSNNIKAARTLWQTLNIENRITFIEQDAVRFFKEYQQAEKFDCIFVDAQKSAYQTLTEYALNHLSEDGFFLFDNFFMRGRVLKDNDSLGQTVHTFNTWLSHHTDLISLPIPLGDGITIAVHRSALALK